MHRVNALSQPYRLFYGFGLKGIQINNKTFAVSADRRELVCLRENRMYYCETSIYTWMEDIRHFLQAEVGEIVAKNPKGWEEEIRDFSLELLLNNTDSNHAMLEIFPPQITETTVRVDFNIGNAQHSEEMKLEFINWKDSRCNSYGRLPYNFKEFGERMFYQLPDICFCFESEPQIEDGIVLYRKPLFSQLKVYLNLDMVA